MRINPHVRNAFVSIKSTPTMELPDSKVSGKEIKIYLCQAHCPRTYLRHHQWLRNASSDIQEQVEKSDIIEIDNDYELVRLDPSYC